MLYKLLKQRYINFKLLIDAIPGTHLLPALENFPRELVFASFFGVTRDLIEPIGEGIVWYQIFLQIGPILD